MLELHEEKLSLFENYFSNEEDITYLGDALIKIKDPAEYTEAYSQYSHMIQKNNFS